jgi:signal transduction histidine kinase
MAEKQRILIADDEAALTDVLASVLEQNNFDVAKAFDGEECILKARTASFDLILLDVHMPKLDGYEVIKQLKQMPQLRHTPIIFLTGYSTAPADIESGYLLGVTEYWKKPMAVEEFEVRVRAILRIAEAERRLRELQEVFNSMIVHDLRGPLSGIVGYVELVSEDNSNLSPENLQMFKTVGTAAKLMLNIVNDFLEITRQEAGEQKLHLAPLYIRDVIDRALSNTAEAQRERSLHVSKNIGEVPVIDGDLSRMELALTQLLDNSIRFTPVNGSLSISATAGPASIVVTVAHSGEGIPAKDLPMLFDKMRITTPGLRRPGSQTGLALPICKGIIEAHEGTISVHSETGKGTTFTIIFPLTTV